MADSVDKPNLTLKLAASYNERGIAGGSATQSGIDQRKINCLYEVAVNPISGTNTVYLIKRPGFTLNTAIGQSSDSRYLMLQMGSGTPGSTGLWVFTKNGSNSRASDSASNNTILSSASFHPRFISSTLISGTETAVVQLVDTTFAGSVAQRVYHASAIGSWTEITDADFTALVHVGQMIHMDGFAFIMTTNNRVYNSDPNSIANWTSTNYTTKNIFQDTAVGLMRLGRIILAGGHETIECFYNAGNATDSPLGRITQMAFKVGVTRTANTAGAGNRTYSVQIGNRLYFLGGNVRGSIQDQGLYMFDGARVEKVSSSFIDKILGTTSVGPGVTLSRAIIQQQEALLISLTGADTNPSQGLLYIPSWNEWFEWTSTTTQMVALGPWFLGIGSAANAELVRNVSDTNSWIDTASSNYTMTVQFRIPEAGNQRKFMSMCALDGVTATSAQSITIEKSDDDYQTFSTLGTIDMTSMKKALYRCGSYRNRVIRISHSGNSEVRLMNFLARIK